MNEHPKNSIHRSRFRSSAEVDDKGAAFLLEWRCQDCRKLLGKTNGAQMQIRRKPLDYIVGFPVHATCPNCGALNAKTKA